MIENNIGLIEMGLVFGTALVVAVWELFSVRRSLHLEGAATGSLNNAGQKRLK